MSNDQPADTADLVFGGLHEGGPFWNFIYIPFTYQGAAMVIDDELRILALHADRPGSGNFAKFLDHVLSVYESVTFLEIMNVSFNAKLRSMGGIPVQVTTVFPGGESETAHGLRLRKTS